MEGRRNDRRKIAQVAVDIQGQGFYEYEGRKIDIADDQQHSEKDSILVTPEQGSIIVRNLPVAAKSDQAAYDGV